MGKLSKEALERFKKLYPERFAELEEQAERDWNKPTPRSVINHAVRTRSISFNDLPWWAKEGLSLEEARKRIAAEIGNKVYLITTELGRRYCECGFDEDHAITKLSRHHGYANEGVQSVELLQVHEM